MTGEEVFDLLEQHHAIIRNRHVVYTSGRHGDAYINKDAIYPDTAAVSSLCQEIASRARDSRIQVVAAPAVGGIALAQWTAHHLSSRRFCSRSEHQVPTEFNSFRQAAHNRFNKNHNDHVQIRICSRDRRLAYTE